MFLSFSQIFNSSSPILCLMSNFASFVYIESKLEIKNFKGVSSINERRGLLPAGWQETFRSAASRLALTQKSPASRLAADL